MEQLITTVVTFFVSLADKCAWVGTVCTIIGGIYVALYALRGVLTIAVKLTKTKKDDKIIETVFAFCDKYSYGFGPFAEYFETYTKKEEGK